MKETKYKRSFINIYFHSHWLVVEFEISVEYGIRLRLGRISINIFNKIYLPEYEE